MRIEDPLEMIDIQTRDSVIERRNFFLGLWAGRLLGHDGEALALYAGEVMASDLEEAGADDIVRRVSRDLAEGGLSQALVESCLRGSAGARIVLPEGADPFVALFSESTGRAIVSVPRSEQVRFTDMCTARGLPHTRIGVIDLLDGTLEVQGQFAIPVRELRAAWSGTLPSRFA